MTQTTGLRRSAAYGTMPTLSDGGPTIQSAKRAHYAAAVLWETQGTLESWGLLHGRAGQEGLFKDRHPSS